MSASVFLIVIAAALLHATWNAAVKGSADKTLGMTAVMVGQALPAIPFLFLFALPSAESLPYFAAGLVFHMGYQIFLMKAYKVGDFTQVYPIARGTGPLIVTLVSILFLGVELLPIELLSIGLIILGISSLVFFKQADGLRNPKAAGLALLTGCCIAGYSLSDGLGARLSESAVGFMSALMFMNGILFAIYIRIMEPGTLTRVVEVGKFRVLGGGIASFLAYLMVVWAFTQAPIALVTALRETSIIFAAMIGVFVFKEYLNKAKILAISLSLCGVVVLRFGTQLF